MNDAKRVRPDQSATKAKPKGFTIVEFLIAITLFGVIMAATVGLLMSQRGLYGTQTDKMQLQQSIRASVDLISSELRTVPPGGILAGRPDSVTVHLPIRWGLVCGQALDASGAEMFLRAAEDALFEDQIQAGYGIKEPGGNWVYHAEADTLWGGTLYAETPFFCKEGAGAKFQASTTYNKDGTVAIYADTASADYPRFVNFTTHTGASPVVASEFIVYTDVTYQFANSTFNPGTRALFRKMPGISQELTGFFSASAGFEYLLDNGTVTDNVGVGNLLEVIEIRVKAVGSKESVASGTSRTLEYDATVVVPLRNMGG